jgi:hypothetical protein
MIATALNSCRKRAGPFADDNYFIIITVSKPAGKGAALFLIIINV